LVDPHDLRPVFLASALVKDTLDTWTEFPMRWFLIPVALLTFPIAVSAASVTMQAPAMTTSKLLKPGIVVSSSSVYVPAMTTPAVTLPNQMPVVPSGKSQQGTSSSRSVFDPSATAADDISNLSVMMTTKPVSILPSITSPAMVAPQAIDPRLSNADDVRAAVANLRATIKGRYPKAVFHHGNGGALPVSADETATVFAHELPPIPSDGSGCQSGGDINQLLSPACLDTLRGPGAYGETPAPEVAPVPVAQVQCGLVIFGAGVSSAPAVFETPDLQSCIATATKMSYGVVGSSNITANDPQSGLVAISCNRPGPTGQTISCQAQ
jgi:hypothetical protein